VLGAERFLVEFIRNTTPSFIEGLSQAQLISLALVFVGIFKLIYIYSRHNKADA
jgi:prolipoprotein diacylglyceryltransferase